MRIFNIRGVLLEAIPKSSTIDDDTLGQPRVILGYSIHIVRNAHLLFWERHHRHLGLPDWRTASTSAVQAMGLHGTWVFAEVLGGDLGGSGGCST